jgi:hypothetical protein
MLITLNPFRDPFTERTDTGENMENKKRRAFHWLILPVLVLSMLLGGSGAALSQIAENAAINSTGSQVLTSSTFQTTNELFIPLTFQNFPSYNVFGFETVRRLSADPVLLQRAAELNATYARVRLSPTWADLQPLENGPVNWSLLAGFENDLRALREANITPVVIVQAYPFWAADQSHRTRDNELTTCARLLPEKYPSFASFMQQLVNRYKSPEFNVQIWELGNEPDVDPNLLPLPNEVYGCWGNMADVNFYGGREYGEMLKIVAPAIRQADPRAKIWIGGLLLGVPQSSGSEGYPERFFSGILEAGAAPYFDAVPYHWYTYYAQQIKDYDLTSGVPWDDLGGGTLGKASFLRSVMANYGVSKPLILNETALGCNVDWYASCADPEPMFYEMQADFVVRAFSRGISHDIQGFMWYMLEHPGWRHSALLYADGTPRPIYFAYQELIRQVGTSQYRGEAAYGGAIEGYIFRRPARTVEVLWTKTDTTQQISIPQGKFIAAYDRSGNLITPVIELGQVKVNVGFSPIYVQRTD